VQRPRTAERDEREVARVETALDGDDAQRAEHLGIHDLDDGRRLERAHRVLRCVAVELDSSSEPLRKPSEQEVRVGNGRVRSTAPVARRPGVGACALRSDPDRASRVDARY
jgi:hypothetical protein